MRRRPESIVKVFERLGIPPSAGLTVGNSMRSDVLPSIAAGVAPVWIDAHVWEYERGHNATPAQSITEKEDLTGVLEMV